MSGYTKTPLIKKLGIKEGFRCRLIDNFSEFKSLLEPIPDKIIFLSTSRKGTQLDYLHYFTNSAHDFEKQLPKLMNHIAKNGMILVSWYKKSSKKQRDVNEDIIRDTALSLGLVDVKVCAIDEEWSGLKLVYRLENR